LKRISLSLCLVAVLLANGCAASRSAYYKVWEKLGYEKRDILVSRVEKGRDAQDAAKKQFATTLDEFKSVTSFAGGDLEKAYNKVNGSYESCNSRATEVSDRITKIDTVAQDLFKEWETELGQYQDQELKRTSQEKLTATKDRYAQLIAAMRKSEASMQPVLKAFHDRVLILKHSLNAEAIASLQTNVAGINTDVQKLISDMEASINEANTFIGNIKS
jgi:hypothetical protein